MMSFYVLSFDNKITATSADWNKEAAKQDGHAARSESVLGLSIWSVIQGADTQSFLNALFFVCRKTQQPVTVPYRCDTPTEARLFEMEIEPLSDEGLRVSHYIMPDPDLDGQTLALHDGAFPQEQCSQCLRVQHMGVWAESFPLLRAGTKGLHYTVCPACRAAALDAAMGLDLASALHCDDV